MSSKASGKAESSARSLPDVFARHTCKTEWKVCGFITISAKEDHFSSSFGCPEKPDNKWYVGMGISEVNNEKSIRLFLKPDFPNSSRCSYNYRLVIENSNSQRIAEWKMASDSLPDKKHKHTVHFVKYSEIVAALVDNELIISAEVVFSFQNADASRFWGNMHTEKGILDDLSVMLGNKTFSDVDIIVEHSGTQKTIPAHRILLASRSPVFHQKLTKDTPEKRERCIKINDLDVETVQDMLAYVYTDKFDGSLRVERVLKLLKCSERYVFRGLKSLCELHLIRNVNDTNAINCLIAADLYNAKELNARCLEIICKSRKNMSRIKEVLNSNHELTQEQRLHLLTEILYQISSNFLP